MGTKLLTTVCLLFCLSSHNVARSAAFANLDFDNVIFPPVEGWADYYEALENGADVFPEPYPLEILPSWNVGAPQLNYQHVCLGTACVSVVGSPYSRDFSVYLQSGTSTVSGDLPLIGAAISQVGEIPADAKSVRFDSSWISLPDIGVPWTSYENLELFIDSVAIPLVPIQFYDNFSSGGRMGGRVLVGADIEAFAGTTVELKIATKAPESYLRELSASIDDISFSAERIPEPSSLMMTITALICATSRRPRYSNAQSHRKPLWNL